MQTTRSLILITVDCLRADHTGYLGYHRATTPFLDCLAGESFVFRNAVAAGSPTYYALPAILASRYPLALGRDVIGIAPEECTLASVLRESGFATAAFSAANPYISRRFGYDQGFDVFNDFLSGGEFLPEPAAEPNPGFRTRANQSLARACHRFRPLGAAYDELYFRYSHSKSQRPEALDALRRFPAADVLVDHGISWLRENSNRPFFLWLHFMDPHYPYFPKSQALEHMGDANITAADASYLNAYWNRSDLKTTGLAKKLEHVLKLYDAGIRWADEQVRRLTETLVELNLWNKCALALTADHGEEFLDHGGRFHPPVKLTQELLHVPLILRVPGSSGRSIDDPVSLIDLAPTLMDVVDIPTPADFRGRSCWNALAANQGFNRPVITECVHGCTNPCKEEKRMSPRILAIRSGNHKLVLDFTSGTEQFFDLSSDPEERNPVPASRFNALHRGLLEAAKKHLVESRKSRDFDRRQAALLRNLRLEWAHSSTNVLH